MKNFEYKIVATEEFCDENETIEIGYVFVTCSGFETYRDAAYSAAADDMLRGMDGGRAFNAAKATAELVVTEIVAAKESV